jgi:hypothetical protein
MNASSTQEQHGAFMDRPYRRTGSRIRKKG